MTRIHSSRAYFVGAGLVALCLGVGGLGGLATAEGVSTWFPGLAKPSWNPPSWVFGPVWTTLYIMMAVAYWRVWLRGGIAANRPAAWWFGAQLALNLAWSFLFFGWRRPDLALVDILLLLIAIGMTARAFARTSRPAAWLLSPYAAWVAFASCLNAAIFWLNRDL